MNPNRKVFISFLSFFLAMLVIACLCSPTPPTPPTVTPVPPNPMPGLAGTWNNPDTQDVYEIAWQNGQYVVTSCTWSTDNYAISSQAWNGSSLTWSYYDTYYSLTVTITTTALNGDNLEVAISYSDGDSASTTLLRGDVTVNPDPEPGVLTGTDSLTVTSAEAGVVTSGLGVNLTIPAGAVPSNEDGSIGSMIFSITQDTSSLPSLPGGYIPVGPVINLGPEGFVFELPVTISIPINAGMDPAKVMGASYYDSGQGVWVLVPGSVDAASRTVQVSTTHLSIWTAWGLSPEMPEDTVNYGSFQIARPSAGMGYIGPDATYSGATTAHGICIRSSNFSDPSMNDRWDAPDNFTFSVDNYWGGYTPDDREPYGKYRVPVGSYLITEFVSQSEINPGNPTYIPRFYQSWRDVGTVTVAGGQIVEFPMPNWAYNEGEWTTGRPPCWGTMTTSVGVGDLQVTLNWNANADLDLHVIEPGGEEIYYGNTFSAASGALDRDNQCNADFVLGRPENIFWTSPPNGSYQVNVVYFDHCDVAAPVSFTVRVCINGNCDNPISGTANAVDDVINVTTFQYP